MLRNFKEYKPEINSETFIAETAIVIGRVKIGFGSSIWYNAVVRGDINYITIGEHTNIQDNAVLHVAKNNPVLIGDYTNVGHLAVVHGCKIGNHCLIGMNSTILNGAVIGDYCIVGAGAVVPENVSIPSYSLVLGVPARVVRKLKPEDIEEIDTYSKRYEYLWRNFYK
jgi:carbonic anhydrase/acetyltransferase-like protein (isoleucine patch superfamily)